MSNHTKQLQTVFRAPKEVSDKLIFVSIQAERYLKKDVLEALVDIHNLTERWKAHSRWRNLRYHLGYPVDIPSSEQQAHSEVMTILRAFNLQAKGMSIVVVEKIKDGYMKIHDRDRRSYSTRRIEKISPGAIFRLPCTELEEPSYFLRCVSGHGAVNAVDLQTGVLRSFNKDEILITSGGKVVVW